MLILPRNLHLNQAKSAAVRLAEPPDFLAKVPLLPRAQKDEFKEFLSTNLFQTNF